MVIRSSLIHEVLRSYQGVKLRPRCELTLDVLCSAAEDVVQVKISPGSVLAQLRISFET